MKQAARDLRERSSWHDAWTIVGHGEYVYINRGGLPAVSGAGAVSSVLVLDENGLLRNGASPNLRADYLHAIDGLRPHAELGTGAAAAATGGMVITPSFLADDKWAELRHLPLAIGFAGAWSMPIKSSRDGRILGTFGTYFRDVRRPSPQEVHAISALAAAAARALDRNRAS